MAAIEANRVSKKKQKFFGYPCKQGRDCAFNGCKFQHPIQADDSVPVLSALVPAPPTPFPDFIRKARTQNMQNELTFSDVVSGSYKASSESELSIMAVSSASDTPTSASEKSASDTSTSSSSSASTKPRWIDIVDDEDYDVWSSAKDSSIEELSKDFSVEEPQEEISYDPSEPEFVSGTSISSLPRRKTYLHRKQLCRFGRNCRYPELNHGKKYGYYHPSEVVECGLNYQPQRYMPVAVPVQFYAAPQIQQQMQSQMPRQMQHQMSSLMPHQMQQQQQMSSLMPHMQQHMSSLMPHQMQQQMSSHMQQQQIPQHMQQPQMPQPDLMLQIQSTLQKIQMQLVQMSLQMSLQK